MKYNLLILLCLSAFVISCRDVIEEDIDDEKVILHSPPHNYITSNSKVSFWWDEVEGATDYRIQVVQPEFRYVEKLVIDSVSLSNKYEATLSPGKYQWKVIAQNSGHNTESSIWSFSVDSADNITQVAINLISPKNDAVTNKDILNFSWELNALVEDYRLELRSPDWDGSLVFPAQLTKTGSFTNTNNALEDGDYEWGVQGLAGTSNTLFSKGKFTLDATSPGTPILNLPTNNSTQTNGNIIFTWNRPSDDGTKIKDSLFIYTDASLNTLARPIQVLDTETYSDSLAQGTYYWRVRSIDEAENTSNYSSTWNVEISQ